MASPSFPSNGTDSPHHFPPTRLLSDQIQLALLLLMFCVGAPVNLVAFTRLLKRRSSGRMTFLKLHLNMSDLMVIFVYVTATVCWQVSYEWRGGESLCKLVKFLSSTSFQASSNLIVTVALDRIFTVLSGYHGGKKLFPRPLVWYVRVCVAVSWISAVIINLPQLYIWRLYSPYKDWHQCTTIYAMYEHKRRLSGLLQSNWTEDHSTESLIWPPLVSQLTYDLTHVLLVFWVPAVLIILSYSLAIILLHRLEVNRRRAVPNDYTELNTVTEIDKRTSTTLTLQQEPWRRRSSGSASRRFSANKEAILSTLSAGDPINGVDIRKGSQSTTTSNIYLVPLEISRVRNNTFRVSFMLVTAYLIFWTPYNVLALWQFVDDSSFRTHTNGIRFLNALIVLNSVVNPFLYQEVRIRRRKNQ